MTAFMPTRYPNLPSGERVALTLALAREIHRDLIDFENPSAIDRGSLGVTPVERGRQRHHGRYLEPGRRSASDAIDRRDPVIALGQSRVRAIVADPIGRTVMGDKEHRRNVDQEIPAPLTHRRVSQKGRSAGQDETQSPNAYGPWHQEQDRCHRLQAAKDGQVHRVRPARPPGRCRSPDAKHEPEGDVEENKGGPQSAILNHGPILAAISVWS